MRNRRWPILHALQKTLLINSQVLGNSRVGEAKIATKEHYLGGTGEAAPNCAPWDEEEIKSANS